jgi:rhodanese-related sulfurtransferase
MGTFNDEQVDVSPAAVKERLESGEIQLVDVREPHEWEAGHIAGARHIELEHLAASAESIERETPVVFQCRLGNRSAMAAQAFRTAGYEAYSMEGGLTAWAERGFPLEPPDGRVAEH